MKYWLVKQEPEDYSWDDFVQDGSTAWTGVRNYQARINLREMQAGDRVLFYHSGKTKAVIGTAEVMKPAYSDPTATEGDWVCVDLRPGRGLRRQVPLAEIKDTPSLSEIALVRNSRLSVMPLTEAAFGTIVELGDGEE